MVHSRNSLEGYKLAHTVDQSLDRPQRVGSGDETKWTTSKCVMQSIVIGYLSISRDQMFCSRKHPVAIILWICIPAHTVKVVFFIAGSDSVC